MGKKYFLLLCFGLIGFIAFGQQTTIIIKGKVTDARNGDALPFVSIVLEGRFIGTSTDTAGNYTLKIPKNALISSDTLTAASLGYRNLKKKINTELATQVIDFAINISDFQLTEIVVKGEDPAIILFRKIQQNKHRNNPDNVRTLTYEAYTKYELDLDGVSKKSIQNDKIMKNFPFLQNYLDTVSEKGKSVLPFFFVENLSDVYQQNGPHRYTEQVKGVKISGIQQEDFITELLGNVNQNFNIYENTITALGKNFISPIADYGFNTYKFFLFYNDTLIINGEPHLEMEFKPRRKGESTLKGKMMVNLNTFAIQSIEAEISESQNTGILEGMSFFQDFKYYKVSKGDTVESYWLPNKEYVALKLNYYLSKDGKIIGRKSKSYRNLIINQPIADSHFSKVDATNVDESAYQQNDEFWVQNRHELLLDKEKGIYSMVDSIKRTSAFKLVSYASRAMATGYFPCGKISFGPFANVFSLNQVEKVRLRLGVQTSDKFSKRMRFMLFGAYGFGDNRFKYGGKYEFIFTRKPWNKITLSARTDVDFMSRHSSEMDYDNVFSIIQKKAPQRLYNIEEFKGVFDHEFHKDLTTYFTIQHQRYSPYFNFDYIYEGQKTHNIVTTELGFLVKYQTNASALSGKFNKEAKANKLFAKLRKKNPYPIIYLRYFAGVKGLMGSQFNYQDLSLGLESELQLTPKQSIFYNIWGGRIFGKLPFLLLKNPEGNYGHVFNRYLFQNMSLLEFSADKYISGNFQYSLGGALFDKIPLWKKLKLTEVLTCNVFYGGISRHNREINKSNVIGSAYPIPYIEAGGGIANILKFIRLDGVWRFTHIENPHKPFFCVYASLYIKI